MASMPGCPNALKAWNFSAQTGTTVFPVDGRRFLHGTARVQWLEGLPEFVGRTLLPLIKLI